MIKVKNILTFLIAGTLSSLCMGCFGDDSQSEKIHPASDRSNTGGWVLKGDMSDKFEGERIDTAKWYVECTDGSLIGYAATYYLRALSIYGLPKQSRKLAKDLAEGYATGIFNGGHGTGHEFRSWEGMPTGYEGTLIGVFTPMYAIAIEEGVLKPPQPEWWPGSG